MQASPRQHRVLALALALAALTAPFAQAAEPASLTLSGMIDLGLYRSSADQRWNLGPVQRSHIAFSGSQDLGDGLKATFKLSHRFNPDDGSQESASKPFWHGESTVGLKGAFGSVQAGRRLDAVNSQDWQFDPWGNFDRVASPAWETWHYHYASDPTGNSGSAEYGRLNSGVFYDSPSLDGFTVHLSTSPEKAQTAKTRPLGVSLNFNHERTAFMLARSRNSADDTDSFAGARLNLAPVAVMVAYNVSEAGSAKAKSLTAGLEYSLGATTLKAGWGEVKVDEVRAARVIGTGVSYAVNARTTVYGDAARKTFTSDSATVYGVGVAYSF
ncbi:porin [Ideonella livida]|uniref:Porin n=1 Tax=Ideonella livida TaxID=2707176 RepID=A0A7C9TLL0_9BURK|nr:porin [Ideonella livida]NDY93238.1 porin [Ideonella livida]